MHPLANDALLATNNSFTKKMEERYVNKVILVGRTTRDVEVKHGDNESIFARFTLAVDRRFKKLEDEQTADFISCVAFGKLAEVAEKYLKQGSKITISGRIQTGSYTNKNGVKVYTTNVVVEEQEFAESKSLVSNQDNSSSERPEPGTADNDGFISIPEGIEDELPFNS